MISKVAVALKRVLAEYCQEAPKSNFDFANARNLAVDACCAINNVVEHLSSPWAAFYHHTGAARALALVRNVAMPRNVTRHATYVKHRDFRECVIGVAQVAFDAFNIAEYAARADAFRCSLHFASRDLEDEHTSAEAAYFKLKKAFSAPKFVRGKVTDAKGNLIDERRSNYGAWARTAIVEPELALAYAAKIGSARLIADTIRNSQKNPNYYNGDMDWIERTAHEQSYYEQGGDHA